MTYKLSSTKKKRSMKKTMSRKKRRQGVKTFSRKSSQAGGGICDNLYKKKFNLYKEKQKQLDEEIESIANDHRSIKTQLINIGVNFEKLETEWDKRTSTPRSVTTPLPNTTTTRGTNKNTESNLDTQTPRDKIFFCRKRERELINLIESKTNKKIKDKKFVKHMKLELDKAIKERQEATDAVMSQKRRDEERKELSAALYRFRKIIDDSSDRTIIDNLTLSALIENARFQVYPFDEFRRNYVEWRQNDVEYRQNDEEYNDAIKNLQGFEKNWGNENVGDLTPPVTGSFEY